VERKKMMLNPVTHDQIMKFLLHHEIHFINVLDYYQGNYSRKPELLNYYPISDQQGNIRSLIAWTERKSYYFYVSEPDIETSLNFFRSRTGRIFSIYGEHSLLNQIKRTIRKPVHTVHEYFVMELPQKPAGLPPPPAGFQCHPCSSRDFSKLARLQELYHLEEVYEDSDSYPYDLEMISFKDLLDERINYAVFDGDKAVSKANVNGESPGYYQLGGIFTLKNYRNRGLSAYCLSCLISRCFREGKKTALYVKKHNHAAVALYKKIGFIHRIETGICYY
jgi:ribosomal protein S18 acetylase RimI-like enzyme